MESINPVPALTRAVVGVDVQMPLLLRWYPGVRVPESPADTCTAPRTPRRTPRTPETAVASTVTPATRNRIQT